MPQQRLLYIEGYIKYTPSRIEKALEERARSNNLELSIADTFHPNDIANKILYRKIQKLSKPFSLEYERGLSDVLSFTKLKQKASTLPSASSLASDSIISPSGAIWPIDDVKKHLKYKGLHEDIILEINDEGCILIQFLSDRLFDLWYDDIEYEAESFIERAFLKYTCKLYKRYSQDYLGDEQYFTKRVVDSFQPPNTKERKKLNKDSSIHIVNMIVDEFANLVKKF